MKENLLLYHQWDLCTRKSESDEVYSYKGTIRSGQFWEDPIFDPIFLHLLKARPFIPPYISAFHTSTGKTTTHEPGEQGGSLFMYWSFIVFLGVVAYSHLCIANTFTWSQEVGELTIICWTSKLLHLALRSFSRGYQGWPVPTIVYNSLCLGPNKPCQNGLW